MKKNNIFRLILKAKNIRLLICDMDGVMSDGFIYLGNNEEFIRFSVKDGSGIQSLLARQIEVAVISGRYSIAAKKRCIDLGIKYIYQNQLNKIVALHDLLIKLSITATDVAYIGDDVIDLPVMQQIGFSIGVADAHSEILSKVDYVTKKSGGNGAVREVCDFILYSKNYEEK